MLDAAHEGFSNTALAEQLLDAATDTIDTPLGPLLVVAIHESIVRIAFDVEDHELVLADLASVLGARIVPARTPVLVAARAQLDEYFAGSRAGFDLPLDLRLAKGPFRLEVLEHLRAIPIGETRTYAELAAVAGRPSAVRAVGSGCATNPVPVVIPCHRVLRTGGALGGYLGGVERKRWLLDHEQRQVG
ncbi:MAG: methylated-DNA--[protein]-cysteine S-methyltransferase [Thermoleophilia bacterium]|nr:methylated-DNA--[protein]-cysteine S-methyltransferase [Thermoleophilia bacterium]